MMYPISFRARLRRMPSIKQFFQMLVNDFVAIEPAVLLRGTCKQFSMVARRGRLNRLHRLEMNAAGASDAPIAVLNAEANGGSPVIRPV